MPYIYRVSRRTSPKPVETPMVSPVVAPVEPAAPEPSYRELQAQAKALDIPANQTADDLKKAIEEGQP